MVCASSGTSQGERWSACACPESLTCPERCARSAWTVTWPDTALRRAGDMRTLIAEVDRAGLTGRGGAGFPTADKLAAVAAGRAPVVIGNGTEGEPRQRQRTRC